jgi:hypothetical protein
MAQVFAITATVNTVRLDAQRGGTTAFTVTNTAGRRLPARARIVASDPTTQGWFTLVEPERTFPVSGTQQFTVQIAVPPSVPAGTHLFRLDVAGVDNPDEEYGQGPNVAVEVPPAVVTKQPFPWLIVAIGAGAGVLVLGLIVFLLTRDGDGGDAPAVVVANTSVTIRAGLGVDLDSGAANLTPTDPTTDITFDDTSNGALFTPRNGAELALVLLAGGDTDGLDACRSAETEATPGLINATPANARVCVRTNAGNLAVVTIGAQLRSNPPAEHHVHDVQRVVELAAG